MPGDLKLTAAEVAAAERAGMDPRRYEALKDVRNIEDFERLQSRSAEAKRADRS